MSAPNTCEQLAAFLAGARNVHFVTEADVQSLRGRCQEGDVAVVTGDFSGRDDLLRRFEAWKVGRIWLGSGPTPLVGLVDAAWVDAPAEAAELLRAAAVRAPGKKILEEQPADSCITCRDEGVVGEVVEVNADGGCAVRFGDVEELVDTALVGHVEKYDLLLVHAGVAIANLAG